MQRYTNSFFLVAILWLAATSNAHAGILDNFKWPGCNSFVSQPVAQAYWKTHGKPWVGDMDRNGIACESLPKTAPVSPPVADNLMVGHDGNTDTRPGYGGNSLTCIRTATVINIKMNPAKYPQTVAHTKAAIKAGQPTVLHLARDLADLHRQHSLAGIATKKGFDRDEYAPAASLEGGTGADVKLVASADNRGAGSSMGAQLRAYCNGQAWQYVFTK